MKTIDADERIQAAREDILAAMKKHGDKLSAPEILALLAHMVGQAIAFQDQRTVTKEMAMRLVCENIEQGNIEAFASLKETAGNA